MSAMLPEQKYRFFREQLDGTLVGTLYLSFVKNRDSAAIVPEKLWSGGEAQPASYRVAVPPNNDVIDT
jgi:hypothetical protein